MSSFTLRKSDARGFVDHGFVKSYHSFSFGEYFDPKFMGYKNLRVINEDFVAPGTGFPEHPHKDMEIITIVLKGTLSHKDSTGSAKKIEPNDVQFMSAGTGITHSEYNASTTDPVHLFQIWIIPEKKGLQPSYAQTTFSPAERVNKLQLIISPDGQNGSIPIHQNAKINLLDLEQGKDFPMIIEKSRGIYLHLIEGSIMVDNIALLRGDAIMLDRSQFNIRANTFSRMILFDLA